MNSVVRISDPDEMRMLSARWRDEGLEVGFVPTMGALHEGHLSLVKRAIMLGDRVVVSIFVNPKQFGPGEDLDRYPRTLEEDLRLLGKAGAHCVFTPSEDDVYPEGHATTVHVSGLTEGLCGRYRPGHFDGVSTVVAILFGMVTPHFAVFGRKDAQQLAVIRRMTGDLRLGVRIEGSETVREPDGLAMSSRNRYLKEEERAQATAIHRALVEAAGMAARGETDAGRILEAARQTIEEAPLARIQYLELVDPLSLKPVGRISPNGLLAVAVYFGRTRLIDNMELEAPVPPRGQ